MNGKEIEPEIERLAPTYDGCSPAIIYQDGTVVNVEMEIDYEMPHLENTGIVSTYGTGHTLHRTAKMLFNDVDKEVTSSPKRFWVDTPDNHHFLFTGDNDYKKAKIWAAITSESQVRIVPSDPDFVPVKIGALGNPAIAGYLYSIHDYTVEEISEQIGVSIGTVRQYLSDIAKGRRVGNIYKSIKDDRSEMSDTVSYDEFLEIMGINR